MNLNLVTKGEKNFWWSDCSCCSTKTVCVMAEVYNDQELIGNFYANFAPHHPHLGVRIDLQLFESNQLERKSVFRFAWYNGGDEFWLKFMDAENVNILNITSDSILVTRDHAIKHLHKQYVLEIADFIAHEHPVISKCLEADMHTTKNEDHK